jgi:hypothetical protein
MMVDLETTDYAADEFAGSSIPNLPSSLRCIIAGLPRSESDSLSGCGLKRFFPLRSSRLCERFCQRRALAIDRSEALTSLVGLRRSLVSYLEDTTLVLLCYKRNRLLGLAASEIAGGEEWLLSGQESRRLKIFFS